MLENFHLGLTIEIGSKLRDLPQIFHSWVFLYIALKRLVERFRDFYSPLIAWFKKTAIIQIWSFNY